MSDHSHKIDELKDGTYTVFKLRTREDFIRDVTSTKGKRIHGPANVMARRWEDGGIDLVIEPLEAD